ncbi:MAG: HAD hydrolase-like protein, partial [Ruminococcus sp.]|nr:HAD hydrolase-like protein [Ruminococcus sp.]
YRAAMKKMGLTPSETAAVGDQLFTDVWGANFSGVKMLYVEPMELEPKSKRFIRFKRVLEKPFLPKNYADDAKEKL